MFLPKFSLEGKIALVNGASRGIGRSIALGLAEAGADVVVSSRKLPDLEKVASEIKDLGRNSLAVASNTRDLDQIKDLVEKTVERFRRIDILINNAACNPSYGSVMDADEPLWDVIMGLNLKGYFFLSQATARIMINHGGGIIVNIASVGGFRPEGEGLAVYSISKAGVISMTKVMAAELGKFNIRVACVAPGMVKTKMAEALWKNPAFLDEILKRSPLHRMAEPEDMAGAVVFLASEAANYVTGETIVVDGGLTVPLF